jgi:hypothetical protein
MNEYIFKVKSSLMLDWMLLKVESPTLEEAKEDVEDIGAEKCGTSVSMLKVEYIGVISK